MNTYFKLPCILSRVRLLLITTLALSFISFANHATLINLFINEIHYDNIGADSNEFIELAGTAGIELKGWAVYLYNGYNGEVYSHYVFNDSLILTNQSNGFGFINLYFGTIQNGPDGIALVDPDNSVVQFISYEGAFIATNGLAIGQESIRIGVAETNTTSLSYSLQLGGSGHKYEDFTWQAPQFNTRTSVNANQLFNTGSSASVKVSEPDQGVITLMSALLLLFSRHRLQYPSRDRNASRA